MSTRTITEEYMHKFATERLPVYLADAKVTEETLSDYCHDLADNMVTYTWDAWQFAFILAGWTYDGVLIMQEETGEKPASIEQAAYWALRVWLEDKSREILAGREVGQ